MFDAMTLSKEQIVTELKSRLTAAAAVRLDEPLARKTTLRVGGPADVYVEPSSETELSETVRFCLEQHVPLMLLGRGSNLLIRDGGIRGVVVSLAHPQFSKIEMFNDHLHCGAGARLKAISIEARRNHFSGFEFLEGIPGTLGGALRMNAGAMGSATFDFVETLRYMDRSGEVRELPRGEISVNYRSCPLLKENIALGAILKGQPALAEAVAQKMKEFSLKRWDSQPAQPSAGCMFKNPVAIPAGKLVEELGFKGTRVGGAMVSDVHGNFIVNEANATARNVLELIELIKARAKETRGIELETEVEIVGED
ncbi:MAG: UDP-N-acetylmuramate dehydrogenase [Verrucomicrobia bacterium]|nr:UDP-N-acetylmuramate dehydrogenase [Verrucomicrobiota bacterium]